MIDLSCHFSTPIWSQILTLDNKSLANHVLSLEAKGGVDKSNKGGFQSNNLDLSTPAMQDFINAISPSVKAVVDSLKVNTPQEFRFLNMWANINRRWNYNSRHSHPSALLSGVYYVAAPQDCGNIVFFRSDGLLETTDLTFGNEIFSAGVEVPAKEGLLVLFPAWVPHEVKQSHTDEPRISISFNIG